MTGYVVSPIASKIARQAREELKSPQYGHPAHVEIASGYGPCRHCLKTFLAGEDERILFTYNPFEGIATLPLPGPIFIHRDDCPGYAGAGFPKELIDLPLVLDGYGAEAWFLARVPVPSGHAETAIEKVFAISGVEYIHVRNAEAGCFIARVERAAAALHVAC